MMKLLRRLRLWLFRVPKPPFIDIDLGAVAKPLCPTLSPLRPRPEDVMGWKERIAQIKTEFEEVMGDPSIPLKPPRVRLTGLSHWKYRNGRLTLICDDCDGAMATSSRINLNHLCIKGAQQAMHN